MRGCDRSAEKSGEEVVAHAVLCSALSALLIENKPVNAPGLNPSDL